MLKVVYNGVLLYIMLYICISNKDGSYKGL